MYHIMCYVKVPSYLFYALVTTRTVCLPEHFCRDGGFNRSDGNYNRSGGFGSSRDRDHPAGGSGDGSGAGAGPQIGTWTSEADANPKTDSWGEMWTPEEDNQWQGMFTRIFNLC